MMILDKLSSYSQRHLKESKETFKKSKISESEGIMTPYKLL